jgi:hypothetical protein
MLVLPQVDGLRAPAAGTFHGPGAYTFPNDVNLAIGNLVDIVGRQATAYVGGGNRK